MAQKRKVRELEQDASKRTALKRTAEDAEVLDRDVEAAKRRALAALETQLAVAVNGSLDNRDLKRLGSVQNAVLKKQAAMAAHGRQRAGGRVLRLGQSDGYADDWDGRVS